MVYFPYLDGMLRTRKDREIKNSTVVVFKILFFLSCLARILGQTDPWLKYISTHNSLQINIHCVAFTYAGQTISTFALGAAVPFLIHSVALDQTGS